MLRRMRGLAVLVAVLVAAATGLAFLLRPRPIEVEAVAIGTGAVEDLVANSEGGTVRSRAQARLGVERAGRVSAIPYREGVFVRRGAIVLRLDASTAAQRLESARSDFEASHAAHEAAHAVEWLARQNLVRAESLHAQSLISREQIEALWSRLGAADADLRAAEARRTGARSAVRLAEDEIAHHQVRAPFDAVVTRRFVEVGEPVIPGQVVLELVSLDRLYVSAPIDERDVGRLRTGLASRVTLDAYPGLARPARITRIAPMVETVKEQNRTLEIELDFTPDPSRPARPGMTADVEIILERREQVARVPTLAVVDGHQVLVVEGGRAVARRIDTGLRNWQWSEVRSGLAPGERVITSLDRAGLQAGVAIRVRSTPAGGGAAPDTSATAAVP